MSDPKIQMTVAELVVQLLLQPQDAKVWHEGCDCLGKADGVTYDDRDHSVLITRSN